MVLLGKVIITPGVIGLPNGLRLVAYMFCKPLLQVTEAGIGVAGVPARGLVEGYETIPGPDSTDAHVIEQSVGGLEPCNPKDTQPAEFEKFVINTI